MPLLGYMQQHQEQDNWCWAAVACSTSAFYDPMSPWTQCQIVNDEKGQTTCCADGSTVQCDVPWYLHEALELTGNLQDRWSRHATEAEIQGEISSDRPLAARIGWNGTNVGHFVVICGYELDEGVLMLTVDDPITGRDTMSYDELCNNYQSNGTWTHSYLTEA